MAKPNFQQRRRRATPPARVVRSTPVKLTAEEHAARASAEVVAAVAAVDTWASTDATDAPDTIDLTDSCIAAVDAAKQRAQELGVTVTQLPGKRVVLRLS